MASLTGNLVNLLRDNPEREFSMGELQIFIHPLEHGVKSAIQRARREGHRIECVNGFYSCGQPVINKIPEGVL